jgi:hypothetical protein
LPGGRQRLGRGHSSRRHVDAQRGHEGGGVAAPGEHGGRAERNARLARHLRIPKRLLESVRPDVGRYDLEQRSSLVLFCSFQSSLVPIHLAEPENALPPDLVITLTTPVDNARQQLTVIDPRTQVMSIYHLELTTGKATLMSVRNIRWDLQVVEFNGVSPLPSEIRARLDSR